ncbi:hypothetical protein R9C00_14430 [Flammeovirgaceae bacterium SG7u.111]|nr:hypothetical protein [Flammeovirgaceae bacterium SG7u.132]WPO38654.1 hypothetical protein R9C00_14430 [Flammeovirgaceae bacterium SG7u.111]
MVSPKKEESWGKHPPTMELSYRNHYFKHPLELNPSLRASSAKG